MGKGYLDLHLLHVPPDLESDALIGASACPKRAITVLADPEGAASAIRGSGASS